MGSSTFCPIWRRFVRQPGSLKSGGVSQVHASQISDSQPVRKPLVLFNYVRGLARKIRFTNPVHELLLIIWSVAGLLRRLFLLGKANLTVQASF
jgi:hypothetical protein